MDVGLTVIVEPVRPPGLQVYVVPTPPLTIKLPLFPMQSIKLGVSISNLGPEITVAVMLLMDIQPDAFCPVNV